MNKVALEIIALMPTFFSHCRDCMFLMQQCDLPTISSQLDELPPKMRETYLEVSQLANRVWSDFGGAVGIRVIDAASAEGLWKTMRHRVSRTPAFLLDGHKVFEGIPPYEDLKRVLSSRSLAP